MLYKFSTYLACDVLICETNDKSVLRRVILVLILGHQTFTGIIIGFTLCYKNKTQPCNGEFL